MQKFAPISFLRSSLFLKWMLPLLLVVALAAYIFTASKSPAPEALVPAPVVAKDPWDDLTPVQKQALAPLAKDWAGLSPDRKQKWLVFATKFEKMKPADQQRALEKMDEWVKLTPEQRLAARESYIRSNNLGPDQRAQKWQEYQQLSDEQKAQLASHREKKKLITNLPTPAESKEKKLQPLKTPNKPATSLAATPTASQPAATPGAELLTPAPIAAPALAPTQSVAPLSTPPSTTN